MQQQNSQQLSSKGSITLITSNEVKKEVIKRLNQPEAQNPEIILNSLNAQIMQKIDKTSQTIYKEIQRRQRLDFLQSENLRGRNAMRNKINQKLQQSVKKRESRTKQMLEKKIQERKLRNEMITQRKRQLDHQQYRKRLDQFKSRQSQNKKEKHNINISDDQSEHQQFQQLRSKSLKNVDLANHLKRSTQIREAQYQKKVHLAKKRRLFDKPMKIVRPHFRAIDKSEKINQMNENYKKQKVQKVAEDLIKIQSKRILRQERIRQTIEARKNQKSIFMDRRQINVEDVKRGNLEKLKARKEIIALKGERYLSARNFSSPLLDGVNLSNYSVDRERRASTRDKYRDSLKISTAYKEALREAHSSDYFERQRQNKQKKQMKIQIEKILKEKKKEILQK